METTDDFSLDLETTVPTDMSLSGDETSEYFGNAERKKRVSKHLYERKQLLHDIQVLKIELSQKGLLLDNLKSEYMQKVDDLEEKLGESQHQRQILQARLESELKIQKTESVKRQDAVHKELESILKRQKQLEETNQRLQEKAVDIRRSLKDLELTEGQYHGVKAQCEEDVSLKDFVAMKLYEIVQPWKLENNELKTRCRNVNDELRKTQSERDKFADALDEEQRLHNDLKHRHQRISIQYADTKALVKSGDYKVENFDRLQRERDEFDAELTELKKKLAYLETTLDATTHERDDLRTEASSCRQTIDLLKKDKDYFSKQVSEMHNKVLYNEEKLLQLNDQLERAKASREELYDKYVASRDSYKTEYENKLREELEQIRMRTNAEIDRLKSSSKEMFERDNRSLREARDMAFVEKDRALQAERDALGKYEQLMQDFRHLQASTDTKTAEMRNEVKLKAFEAERAHIVYEESVRTLKECQLENEKLQKKLQVMVKEHYTMHTSADKRVAELETQLAEKNVKLESYVKLEQELDDVVMQAAEVDDEEDAERVLFSYGYGANVPTNSKRRLKQSVHLARRVLALERENSSLTKEVELEKTRNKQTTQELKSANAILDQSHQPYHYLVEGIRLRDQQIAKQKDHITTIEEDLRKATKQKENLSKSKNQLASDLERLLNQKEEMSVMKQVVLNLSQRRIEPDNLKPVRSRDPLKPSVSSSRTRSPTRTAVHEPKHYVEGQFDEHNIHKPAPTQFTSSGAPDWYKKVHQKAKKHQSHSGYTYAS